MRIRRTPKELKRFNSVVEFYMSQGYPKWKAEENAFDHFYVERRIKSGVTA